MIATVLSFQLNPNGLCITENYVFYYFININAFNVAVHFIVVKHGSLY